MQHLHVTFLMDPKVIFVLLGILEKGGGGEREFNATRGGVTLLRNPPPPPPLPIPPLFLLLLLLLLLFLLSFVRSFLPSFA